MDESTTLFRNIRNSFLQNRWQVVNAENKNNSDFIDEIIHLKDEASKEKSCTNCGAENELAARKCTNCSKLQVKQKVDTRHLYAE